MTDPHPGPPGVDLPVAEVARAEARSRASGPWSLEHLRICWIALALVGAPLAGIVAATVGTGAAAAVAVGTLIVGGFFTVSTVFIAWVGARSPHMVLGAALGAYVAKIIALGIVVIMLPRDGWLTPRWLAIAVVAGLVAWLAAHLRWVWTAKIFYVDPTGDR